MRSFGEILDGRRNRAMAVRNARALQPADMGDAIPTGRRVERQLDRDTSATRKQTGGHPHRLHGSHDGMTVTEHHRKGSKA